MPTTMTIGTSVNHVMLALERNEMLQQCTLVTLFGAIVADFAYLAVFLFA